MEIELIVAIYVFVCKFDITYESNCIISHSNAVTRILRIISEC